MPQCWGLPVMQSGASLNCSLFRARLCWGGGSVTIGGFVLYAGRNYALHRNIMLLVQVMAKGCLARSPHI